MTRKAIGIVRVSQVGGREGESFASPLEQADRIRAACKRHKLRLLEIHEELDISGGAPLHKRPGLAQAVQSVEAGEAQVVVAAYFDRLIRSLEVQNEFVSRVEAANGSVLAVDVGAVSHATAAQWLSGTLLGAFAEYQRRTTAERTHEAQARAIARGVLPYRHVPPGLRRRQDGVIEPDPDTIDLIRLAYQRRAEGSSIADVRSELGAHGMALSYTQVRLLLRNRIYIGELHHHGHQPNLSAIKPTVDRALWQRVQRMTVPRGRKPKSDRLLARLGVLRCGTCGGGMVVGTGVAGGVTRHFYRCSRVREDCPARMNISATLVERVVVDAVRELLADREGRASAQDKARRAVQERDKAQEDLSAAIRAFAGLEDEEAAQERLGELRAIRDAKQARVEQLGGAASALTVSARHWDHLSLEGRRALIRATLERVVVNPGSGVERVLVVPLGE